MNKTDDEEIPVYASSGNIFADLGRPDAEEAFARVRQLVLLEELRREIQKGIDSGESRALIPPEMVSTPVSEYPRGWVCLHKRIKTLTGFL